MSWVSPDWQALGQSKNSSAQRVIPAFEEAKRIVARNYPEVDPKSIWLEEFILFDHATNITVSLPTSTWPTPRTLVKVLVAWSGS